jgi:predicted site-specific integrase-resolvase
MGLENDEPFYTSREAAKKWRVSPKTIRRHADAGNLKGVGVSPGGHKRYSKKEVEGVLGKLNDGIALTPRKKSTRARKNDTDNFEGGSAK